MHVTSLYPVLLTGDVAATTTFYRETFDFAVTFEADWYVSLRLGAFELAILAHDHPTVPQGYRERASGVLVNIEVEDVDAVYTHLTEVLGVVPVMTIRSEDFGQRHFVIAAPDGVLVDIIQPIEPSAEFAAAFAQA